MIICPKYLTFPSGGNVSTFVPSISISFNLFAFWFVRIFVVSVNFEPLRASVSFLKSVSCFTEVAIVSTSSAKRRLDIQSLFSSLCLMPKPFSFQVSTSLSLHYWRRTELTRRLPKGSPCFFPRAILNSSLSTSVSTVARWSVYNFSEGKCTCSLTEWFLRNLQVVSCCIESNVDRCHPHVSTPFSAFLGNKSVRHKAVRCLELFSESCRARGNGVGRVWRKAC